jgi:hypothetical protein
MEGLRWRIPEKECLDTALKTRSQKAETLNKRVEIMYETRSRVSLNIGKVHSEIARSASPITSEMDVAYVQAIRELLAGSVWLP